MVAVDLDPAKQANALEVGAHASCGPDDDPGAADVVLDFLGAESTLALAASSVRRRGLVAVVGLFGGRIPFGLGAVPHEAHFLSSFWGSQAQMDELLDLARREPAVVGTVEVVGLSEAQWAHERLRAGDVSSRLVLDPRG